MTVKMVSMNKYEVELIKDRDGMYFIRHGHVLGPIDKKSELIEDYNIADMLFQLKLEEYASYEAQ